MRLPTENRRATVVIMSVGFVGTGPLEELRRVYNAVKELRKSLADARKSFDSRQVKQLDTDIANAWLISTEIERRLANAGAGLASPTQTSPAQS